MYFNFTRNVSIGSRLICWVLDEPVSHVSVELANGLVIHSRMLTGVTLDWHVGFKNKNEIVYRLSHKLNASAEKQLLNHILNNYSEQSYDYVALMEFAWHAIKRKLFGIEFPPKLRYNQPKKFLCTELADKFLTLDRNEFVTPYRLYKDLLDGRI